MVEIPDEGAWYQSVYRSPLELSLPQGAANSVSYRRRAASSIYALISRDQFSALHRLKSDEIWHFYTGDAIELLRLYPNGTAELTILGGDILDGQEPQVVISAGTWMGARPMSDSSEAYSFFGCTSTPGFEYEDYEAGYRLTLQTAYPAYAELIAALTRHPFEGAG
ncbi:MAG: cupin domain-containing protein [Puniceicoccaceae bacterium]|nr:MAG: cupin domain-containing protein [Puniceicoccaceae bacterium]